MTGFDPRKLHDAIVVERKTHLFQTQALHRGCESSSLSDGTTPKWWNGRHISPRR